MDTQAFLRRIGISEYDGPPRLEALSRLHEAYVDQVPYESVQFQLTPGDPLDPDRTARRIVARETGGYCFQLNGTFALLLTELGYRVRMHRGGAQTANRPGDVDASHMVLTVSGLVEDPERVWLVDAGLGEALTRPMPLEVGSTYQEPFALGLRPSEKTDGWRLDHDPRANLIGMDFESAAVGLDAFAAQHATLSTDPESPFRRLASAFRRKPASVVVLRSVGLSEIFADRIDTSTLENPADYFAVLADVFHLPLPHFSRADRDRLWRRVWAQYEDFLAAGPENEDGGRAVGGLEGEGVGSVA
ncbi:arylamine N-acetyltransferase family protein [Kribbella sp. CA-247076]|uniref:arylamine N-acetyltransferase family protein n=1 Tax=Kribbella sp. CA-247076 TaxID=3239941 RepID=UPI003D8D876E